MAFEIAMILLGAGVGVGVVLFAAPRGHLGYPRKKGASSPTEQASAAGRVAVATAPAGPAPPPAPAIYETMQPATSQVPGSFAGSGAALGSSAAPPRRSTRAYRRRAPPRRPTAVKTAQPAESAETAQAGQPDKSEQ